MQATRVTKFVCYAQLSCMKHSVIHQKGRFSRHARYIAVQRHVLPAALSSRARRCPPKFVECFLFSCLSVQVSPPFFPSGMMPTVILLDCLYVLIHFRFFHPAQGTFTFRCVTSDRGMEQHSLIRQSNNSAEVHISRYVNRPYM